MWGEEKRENGTPVSGWGETEERREGTGLGEESELHLGQVEAERSVGHTGAGGHAQEAMESLGRSELTGRLCSLGWLNQQPWIHQSSLYLFLRRGVESSCQDPLGHLLPVSSMPGPQQGVAALGLPLGARLPRCTVLRPGCASPLGNSRDMNLTTEAGGHYRH